MSALPGKNAASEPDKQLKNFLTLKAKVIHTDELIRRYREKGQECSSLQEQLRQALSHEASLKQSLVGLRAEVNALLREKKGLQDVVTACQWEKELAEIRATNAEMVVQQLMAQVDTYRESEAQLRIERDGLTEQCSQLQEQLKKTITVGHGGNSLGISPTLQFLLCGRRRRHHSFTSSFSLPTSPPLSSAPPTPFSLPGGIPHPPSVTQEGSEVKMDIATELTEEEDASSKSPEVPTSSDLDFSVSDCSSEGGEEASPTQNDDDLLSASASEHDPSSPLVSAHRPAPSPLVHAAADTMNSDSDSELCLSEVESLSPIPPSPNPRLPTLSPLPLSPATQTLSPLPSSPPPPPFSFSLSDLPQFVSSAPETCRVPVPSVRVTSSPPPIVSPSRLHHSTLHRSHLSPFSAANLPQTHYSPVLQCSPKAVETAGEEIGCGDSGIKENKEPFENQNKKPLDNWNQEPTYEKPADVGNEKPADMGNEKPADIGNGKPADMGNGKPADMGNERPADMGNEKPADMRNEKPADMENGKPADMGNEKPTDVGNEKPQDVENGKPADMGNEKPTDMENGKPADMGNEKPADMENGKPADMGNEKPQDMENGKPADMGNEKPADRENGKPADMGNEKPADMENGKPADMGNEKPQDMENGKPADMGNEKPADMENGKPADMGNEKPQDMENEKPADMGNEKPQDMENGKPADMGNEKPADRENGKPADMGNEKPADMENGKPADMGNEKPQDMENGKPADMGNEKPADMENGKPADMGNEKPQDMENEKPADMGNEKPADMESGKPADMGNEKPADMGNEKPQDMGNEKPADMRNEKPADMENGKPADMGNEKPADMGNEKPADVGNEKPQDMENAPNLADEKTFVHKSGDFESKISGDSKNEMAGNEKSGCRKLVAEMKKGVKDSSEVSQCAEIASTAELEDGEIGEVEATSEEELVLLEDGKIGEVEATSEEELVLLEGGEIGEVEATSEEELVLLEGGEIGEVEATSEEELVLLEGGEIGEVEATSEEELVLLEGGEIGEVEATSEEELVLLEGGEIGEVEATSEEELVLLEGGEIGEVEATSEEELVLLEGGEIGEVEATSEEELVLLEGGVFVEGENGPTAEVLANPAPQTIAEREQPPSNSSSFSASVHCSTVSQRGPRECVLKRGPSEPLAGPHPKATKLNTTPDHREALVQERDVGEESSTRDNSSLVVRIESVREHPTEQTPGVGVGYSAHPTTPQSIDCSTSRSSSSAGTSLLQTDRATGQVEELAKPTQSHAPPSSLEEPGSSGSASSDSSLSPSLLQQSLCPDLLCPLALPDWLLSAMLRVQSNTDHNPQLFRKKKSFHGGKRQPTQKAHFYVGSLLERMMTGEVSLSTVVKLLSDPWNCVNSAVLIRCVVYYFQNSYKPRIEHVMSTYNTLCSDARSKTLESPTSPSFPSALLRPECQLLALLYHTSKLNPSTSNLLPDLVPALYTTALSPLSNFHKMAAITRVFTGVCRLLGQRERVLLLACDLLRKPLSCQELPVVTGMVGVWPAVFARRPDMQLVVSGRLNLSAVEAQPLSYAVEVVVTVMMKQGGLSQHHINKLHTLGQWSTGQTITAKTVDKLASVLLQLLQTSRRVTVEQEPCQGWFRPRPSRLTFHLVHTLRLISWFKGWVWTSDVLIKAHIWPILQSWNGKRDSVPEATVMAAVRLLGFIGQQGAGSADSSLAQLQKLLLSLLIRQETPLSVQLCAAESLIDLCPPSLPSSREAVAVLWQWLRGLANHPAGPHLSREFCPKLCTAPPHLTGPSSSLSPTNS